MKCHICIPRLRRNLLPPSILSHHSSKVVAIVLCYRLSVVTVLCCYLCCSVIIVLFYVLIVCTVTLPPGVNPIAVDKYIYIQKITRVMNISLCCSLNNYAVMCVRAVWTGEGATCGQQAVKSPWMLQNHMMNFCRTGWCLFNNDRICFNIFLNVVLTVHRH